jgi:hypothetical protein
MEFNFEYKEKDLICFICKKDLILNEKREIEPLEIAYYRSSLCCDIAYIFEIINEKIYLFELEIRYKRDYIYIRGSYIHVGSKKLENIKNLRELGIVSIWKILRNDKYLVLL